MGYIMAKAFVRAAAAGAISAAWSIYVGAEIFPFPLFFGIVLVIISFLKNGTAKKTLCVFCGR